MTTDLATWLREQLDADERNLTDLAEWARNGIDSVAGRDVLEYVDRVPAEVDAKRRIVELHQPYGQKQVMARGEIWACSECGSVDDSPTEWPCDTILLLTLPYADRPGYRERWRP